MQQNIERVEAALNDLRQGKMILLTDHPDREDEADMIFPAEIITSDVVNFMIRHGSGIICLPLMEPQLKRLGLSLMVAPHENTTRGGTSFTVSIEAKHGVATGVSAQDRATTILTAVKENVTQDDIVKPGHIFPLQAKKGGVLERAGHTEGAIDLVRLAGFKPAAVLCEIMNVDGTMTRGEKLLKFANEHQLKILSIADIIDYRLRYENLIQEEVCAKLPLATYGDFTITAIREKFSNKEHLVLKKNIKSAVVPLVRIHSSCATGDLFGSQRCDCHQQLQYSLQRLREEGGILIYLQPEGREIGLFNKIKSYALQDQGLDTVEANEHLGTSVDSRMYYIAAHILRNLNIQHIRLLTNNLAKINDLKNYGIARIEQELMPIFLNEHNKNYLQIKKEKLHHMY